MSKKRKKEESIDPQDLPRNFNIAVEQLTDNEMANSYFLHNKYWTPKILYLSMVINICSLVLLFFGMISFIFKPSPAIYGSTEFGSIYPLQGLSGAQALELVRENKMQSTQNAPSNTSSNANDTNSPSNLTNSGNQNQQSQVNNIGNTNNNNTSSLRTEQQGK